MWSKHNLSAVHLLTCSPTLSGVLAVCPSPSLGFWEQMTPEWKLVNFCPKSAFQPRFTCRGQIWRKSAFAKLPKSRLGLLTNKTQASGTLLSPPPFRPHLTDRAQNFVIIVGPWPVHVYRLWSRSAAVCRTYCGKSPNKWLQYNMLSAYKKHSLRTASLFVTIGSEMKKWRTYTSSRPTSEINASHSIANCNFNLTLIRCSN